MPVPDITNRRPTSMEALPAFRFADMPAELKNEVYALLLEHGTVYVHDWRLNGRKAIIRRATSVSTSTLLVSRQMHDEAAAVLYGSNEFELISSNRLNLFLRQLGSHVKYLRAIKVLHLNCPRTTQLALRRLEKATLLRRLAIQHPYHKSARETAEHVAPWRPKSGVLRKGESQRETWLDVLTIECSSLSASDGQQKARAYQEEVRRLLNEAS